MSEITLNGLDTALEEARRRFDHEEGRRQTIDTKTSIILAIDGILLTLVQVGNYNTVSQLLLVFILLFAVIAGVITLRPRAYRRVGKMRESDPDEKGGRGENPGSLAKFLSSLLSIDSSIYRKVDDNFGNPTNRLSLEGQDPNHINHYDLNEYAQMSSDEIKKHFLFQSCLIIHHNWEINRERSWWFRQSYRFTSSGILIILVLFVYNSIQAL